MFAVTVAAATCAPATVRADADDLVTRPLVLAEGQLAASLALEISLVQRSVGTPISLAPDVGYGVARRWTVALIHSSPSVDRITAGSSFCVRQSDDTCDRAYRGSGVDVRYLARDGSFAIAPRARLLVRDVDPWKPALTAGALARWQRGRFAVIGDPYLRLGLANRDRGNRAALVLPIALAVQPTCRWVVALKTGAQGDLAVWRDGWYVPVSLAVTAAATAQLDLAVEAGLQQAYGPQTDIKQRAVVVTATWRTL